MLAALSSLSPRNIKLLCAAIAGVVALVVAIMLFSSLMAQKLDVGLFAGRNFHTMPFSMLDAIDLCQEKLDDKYGDSLQRSYLNENSTRFKEKTQEYFIVMHADVGEKNFYDEMLLYCDVDPRKHELSYFKQHVVSGRSFMEKAFRFFR